MIVFIAVQHFCSVSIHFSLNNLCFTSNKFFIAISRLEQSFSANAKICLAEVTSPDEIGGNIFDPH